METEGIGGRDSTLSTSLPIAPLIPTTRGDR
jgi:hypothetical protein